MNVGRTLFSQVMDFVPWTSFDRIVARYGGDVRVRSLRCSEQFRIMAFAQMTYRESLRDIEACLGAQPSKLYSMGLREAVARSTLADANELRDAYGRTSPRFWFAVHANYTSAMKSGSISPIPFMLSIARRSICACRCFRGPIFVRPNRP